VPRVRETPGVIGAYWVRSRDDRGMGVILFESEEAAQGLARWIESTGPPTDAVTLDRVEVCEVVAHV
jgi:hypothetical protein